jgi:hypothetical protein
MLQQPAAAPTSAQTPAALTAGVLATAASALLGTLALLRALRILLRG